MSRQIVAHVVVEVTCELDDDNRVTKILNAHVADEDKYSGEEIWDEAADDWRKADDDDYPEIWSAWTYVALSLENAERLVKDEQALTMSHVATPPGPMSPL